MKKRRYIVHIDMDAFFASIEERDRPELRGKPIVVGADPDGGKARGVVSTCSYEARKYGIHSAMPISVAFRMCPKAIFLPVDMDKYEEASAQIYEILYSFSPDIEPISIDEAFLDITGSYHLFGTPIETCRLIKEKIKKLTAAGNEPSCERIVKERFMEEPVSAIRKDQNVLGSHGGGVP